MVMPEKTVVPTVVPEGRSAVLASGLYGLELSRATGLPNGTLFPVLNRLRRAGWVERYWESGEVEGRPRRRFYRLTSEGAAAGCGDAGFLTA